MRGEGIGDEGCGLGAGSRGQRGTLEVRGEHDAREGRGGDLMICIG